MSNARARDVVISPNYRFALNTTSKPEHHSGLERPTVSVTQKGQEPRCCSAYIVRHQTQQTYNTSVAPTQ